MKDMLNRVHTQVSIAPVALAANATTNGLIIDRQGYDSLAFIIATGVMGAAGVFAVSMDEGNAANLSDASAVAAVDMVGQGAGGAPTAVANAAFTQANTAITRKIGYTGSKRYVRVNITLSGNTGSHLVSAVALLADAVNQPTANPPQ